MDLIFEECLFFVYVITIIIIIIYYSNFRFNSFGGLKLILENKILLIFGYKSIFIYICILLDEQTTLRYD
jgi:hypothetical protein